MYHAEKKALEFVHRHRIKLYVLGILVLFIFLNIASQAIYNSFQPKAEITSTESTKSEGDASSSCNVLGINLHGTLLTYIPPVTDSDSFANRDVTASEGVMSLIERAQSDDNIKAILVEVDSSGGSPVAGEEISESIKASTKPVIAYIRQGGMSAAYWAVTSAEKIFASKNSDVGSIGVTSSYLDNVSKNKKDGLSFIQLSTGKFKDTGNPDKPLTDEEKALIMRDVKIVYANFINDVAKNRNLSVASVKAVADGSSVLGDKAKELGLIDSIGGYPEAKKYIEEKIGTKADICW